MNVGMFVARFIDKKASGKMAFATEDLGRNPPVEPELRTDAGERRHAAVFRAGRIGAFCPVDAGKGGRPHSVRQRARRRLQIGRDGSSRWLENKVAEE